MELKEDITLDKAVSGHKIGALVHGQWESANSGKNELSVLRELDLADELANIPIFSYEHTYPRKEEGTVILG
ncbi:MAG: hypothetical protein ACI4ES_08775 [Roseburia sp.]